ncbi:HpcH/HpaI aldolase family protein [Sandaracinobacteroides saxicola]|uniref:Aldolase n=1 Tax=Sandaracinobacteroides saxicola TaxID=2759707 RepID=A0A7G5IJN0_9SPHN|nr:aldolase/citrate lyase family protein [Sandaracinobacteroides saxicola]QMW23572.1 aldolase [Sandaracinobacteroides saxicola]
MNPAFKAQVRGGALTVGTWLKTPHPTVAEVLALSPLDCLVLDAEHAPFGRAELDACVRAAGAKPVLIRPESAAPAHLLQALDYGAAGVIVPHVRSAAEARAIVRACHFGPGGRGYAGTTRSAGFGTRAMATNRADAAHVTVIAQIEDAEALDEIEAIARVDGLDALFIGRADLTISLDAASPDDPRVVAAVEAILAAGRAAGKAIGMFLPRPGDAALWRGKGASLFLLASDHDFLLAGAKALAAGVRA